MTEATQIEAGVPHAYGRLGRNLAASVIASLAIASGPVKSHEAPRAEAAGLGDCTPYFDTSRYRNHEYEVCTAYTANSAEVALQGFYKFGNNRAGYLADTTRHHFETRYWGEPRQSIERDVDSWPKTSRITGNRVKEDIDVISVSSSLKADRGLVQTRENWDVAAPNGEVLHHEPRHTKNITMCRGKLAGHLLHEWVVVKFARSPKFNCIAFDKRHGITP